MTITVNQIYSFIESEVNTQARPVYCASKPEPIPKEFPACQIIEINHTDYQRALPLTFATHESLSVRRDFEAHVYSALKNGALSEAKSIMNDVEIAFRQLSFIETMCMQTENADPTITHLVARFTRNIGDGDTIQTT